MTNAEARFNNSLRPRKPEGSLGRTAQDVHLDSHTAPELWAMRSSVMMCSFHVPLIQVCSQMFISENVFFSCTCITCVQPDVHRWECIPFMYLRFRHMARRSSVTMCSLPGWERLLPSAMLQGASCGALWPTDTHLRWDCSLACSCRNWNCDDVFAAKVGCLASFRKTHGWVWPYRVS